MHRPQGVHCYCTAQTVHCFNTKFKKIHENITKMPSRRTKWLQGSVVSCEQKVQLERNTDEDVQAKDPRVVVGNKKIPPPPTFGRIIPHSSVARGAISSDIQSFHRLGRVCAGDCPQYPLSTL
jgi:hypothetical protein